MILDVIFDRRSDFLSIQSKFKQKLQKLVFIQVKKEALEELFKTKLIYKEDIFIPLEASYITEEIIKTYEFDSIPLHKIIKSMFLVLGLDEDFKYNNIYKTLIIRNNNAINYIKSEIASYVKNEDYEEAYVLLKGLIAVEEEEENIEKAICIAEVLRVKQRDFAVEELKLIEYLKSINDYGFPYFYEALIYKDEEKYEMALLSIEECIKKEGSNKKEAVELKKIIKDALDYEEGKSLVYDNPSKALEYLLPMIDTYEDNAMLFYHIAVAYRLIGSYEKAIYYLNQSRNIDDNILEVVNEMGLNHAHIEDYKNAISYFKKGFEVSQGIEFCTNLIMCYLKIGDKKEANNYFKKAKEIDPKDEILIEIEKSMK